MALNNLDKTTIDRAYWLTVHRLAIEKWTTIGLYVVNGFVFAWFFVQFGVYLYTYDQWRQLVAASAAPIYSQQRLDQDIAPLDLAFGNPQVFFLGDDRYNLVVEVSNPNTQWAVQSMKYQFTVNGQKLASQEDFVLPQEHKFLTLLNYRSDAAISRVDSVSDFDYHWRKIRSLPPISWIYTKPPAFQSKRVLIQDNKQVVIPASVSWSVKSGSTIRFPKVTWQVALYGQGQTLLSILSYASENISFLVEQDFQIYVYDQLPHVEKVVVTPVIDLFSGDYPGLR